MTHGEYSAREAMGFMMVCLPDGNRLHGLFIRTYGRRQKQINTNGLKHFLLKQVGPDFSKHSKPTDV